MFYLVPLETRRARTREFSWRHTKFCFSYRCAPRLENRSSTSSLPRDAVWPGRCQGRSIHPEAKFRTPCNGEYSGNPNPERLRLRPNSIAGWFPSANWVQVSKIVLRKGRQIRNKDTCWSTGNVFRCGNREAAVRFCFFP